MLRRVHDPVRAPKHDYASQIEVNVPSGDAPLSEDTSELPQASRPGQVSLPPDLSRIDSHWAVFTQHPLQPTSIAESDPSEQEGNHNKMSREGRLTKMMRMAASDSLLAEKLLLIPHDILHRLHRSHLAQLDELWALRTLHQQRQLNVQKWQFLKEPRTIYY